MSVQSIQFAVVIIMAVDSFAVIVIDKRRNQTRTSIAMNARPNEVSVRRRQAPPSVDGDAEMRCQTRLSVRNRSSATSQMITITSDVGCARPTVFQTRSPGDTLSSCHASVYSES